MSFSKNFRQTACLVATVAAALTLVTQPAHAVPSYARQTGLACEACHTVFPELTPFGRLFKMNGYVLQNVKPLQDINEKKESTLSIGDLPPVSAMFVTSIASTAHAQPDSTNNGKAQNGTVGMPQQASLFYAGRIADNFGAYFQLTYAPANNSIGIDNTDLRFADHGQLMDEDFIYGVTVNNNPTVQDVWNTVPAWTFPFLSANSVPIPGAQSKLLTSLLAQQTAGTGPYVFINRSIYAEVGAYRSAKVGTTTATQAFPLDSTSKNVIEGAAPYWRLAWNHEWGPNSLEIGHWGMHAALNPGAGALVVNTTSNTYTDLNFDSQYQYIGDNNIITVTANFLHEDQKLNAAVAAGLTSNTNDHINRESLVAAYYYQRKFGGSLGVFNISGNSDPLGYASTVTGSALTASGSGTPDSRWMTAELDYLPWLNTKLFLQYTAYSKFNGASGQYNPSQTDRTASDNNTIYGGLWFAF